MRIKRIPKGTPVKYFVPRRAVLYLKRNEISFKPVKVITESRGLDKAFLIEAFVSGDEKEKGLSIVALDNPTVCLFHAVPGNVQHGIEEDRIRKTALKGYAVYVDISSPSHGIAPVCPY